MAIDASIALQGKLPQLQSPNELMANAYALKQTQMANQLGQMKMDEYTRNLAEEDQIKNALTRLNPASPTYKQDRYNAFALKGPEGLKTLSAIEKEEAATGETTLKSKGQKVSNASAAQEFAKKSYEQIYGRTDDTNIDALYADAVDSGLFDEFALAGMKKRGDYLKSIPLGPVDPTTGRPDFSARRKAINDMQLEAKDRMPKPQYISQQNVMVNGVPTTRELQILDGVATPVAGSSAATYNKPAASTVVNVDNKQESEFNKQLGGGQAKKVLDDKVKAEDAAQILATNKVAKDLLDKGMLTGVGANFFTTLNQGLSQAGIDFGLADAAKNSQAYGALMAINTAKIIKNFGAGTGISDADRIYAKQAAAGDITMDENAIRKIINVNDRVAKAAIAKHNKNVSGIKTNIPLTVDPADYSAGIPEGRAGETQTPDYKKVLNNIFPKVNK
jgi:hypothetical protein